MIDDFAMKKINGESLIITQSYFFSVYTERQLDNIKRKNKI